MIDNAPEKEQRMTKLKEELKKELIPEIEKKVKRQLEQTHKVTSTFSREKEPSYLREREYDLGPPSG